MLFLGGSSNSRRFHSRQVYNILYFFCHAIVFDLRARTRLDLGPFLIAAGSIAAFRFCSFSRGFLNKIRKDGEVKCSAVTDSFR